MSRLFSGQTKALVYLKLFFPCAFQTSVLPCSFAKLTILDYENAPKELAVEVPEMNETNMTDDKDVLINLMLTGFNSTPYHQHIGLRMLREPDGIKASFSKQQHLLGNVSRDMVHGGLVSSVFDAFGGVLCSIELIDKYKDMERKQGLRKLNRLCTVALNINYHAPAKSENFVASGEVIHQGSSIMSVSMRMHDEKKVMIASASANYMY